MSDKPRVIYMGTPDFSVPALRVLNESNHCDLALVITQPDRPAGRGKKLVSPPVRMASDELTVPVIQVGTLRDPDVRQRIVDIEPDLVVVAAFGMILGRWILELPPRGCVNLHASVLPKYRGANPIAAAIAMGEDETGVTLMRMDRGLDTGDIYAVARIDIARDDTTESLTPKLAHVAASLLKDKLPLLLDGSLTATPQGRGATLTRPMTKNDGWMDFNRPAVALDRHVRAMWSWPRAWTTAEDGTRIQIHSARVRERLDAEPGTVVHQNSSVAVACGTGALELIRVQLPGGKPIEGHAVRQSHVLPTGAMLGRTGAPSEEIPPLVVSIER